jgi:hypothetical protein
MRESLDRKRVGAAKLAARRTRIATIRVRVAACSGLVFAVLWVTVFAQLVVGRDPALAVKARAQRRAAVTRSRLEVRRRQEAVIDLGKLRPRVVPRRPRPTRRAPVEATPPPPVETQSPTPAAPVTAPPPAPEPAPAPAPTPVVTSQS